MGDKNKIKNPGKKWATKIKQKIPAKNGRQK
jgi:hypothetical protein